MSKIPTCEMNVGVPCRQSPMRMPHSPLLHLIAMRATLTCTFPPKLTTPTDALVFAISETNHVRVALTAGTRA